MIVVEAYAVLVGDTDVVSWSGSTLETGVGLEVEVKGEWVGDTVVDNGSYDRPHQLVSGVDDNPSD